MHSAQLEKQLEEDSSRSAHLKEQAEQLRLGQVRQQQVERPQPQQGQPHGHGRERGHHRRRPQQQDKRER